MALLMMVLKSNTIGIHFIALFASTFAIHLVVNLCSFSLLLLKAFQVASWNISFIWFVRLTIISFWIEHIFPCLKWHFFAR